MAEGHPVFSIGWNIEINDMLSRPKEDTILRVATHLLKTKPEAYIPQFLSIGPSHHANLDKDIHDECAGGKISRAEMHKAKVAAILRDELLQHDKSFKSIVDLTEAMRQEINQFYDWRAESQNTALDQMIAIDSSLIAIDSSFLLLFLIGLYVSRERQETAPVDDRHPSRWRRWRPSPSLHDDMIELRPLEVLCIKSDILKLENQIPLTLLETVFDYAREALIYRGLPEDLDQLLHKTCAVLSSFKFEVSDDEYIERNEATVENQPHLLAYTHALVSPILQMKPEDQDADLCTRIKFHILKWNSPSVEGKSEIALNAEKLAKNGIKFTGRDKMIRFDSWSGTLYLPRINVTEMQTEVLLRNMLSWEVNHKSRGNSVTDYVGLMQCLIQTRGENVRVLRDSRVIESTTLTDESIARMWNGLARPFFSTDNLGPHSEDLGRRLYFVLHKTFHVIKIRRIVIKIRRITRMLGDLYDYLYDCVTNLKFIGFIAGFLGLAFTATQAYFTVFPRNV